jgi:CDI toxin RNase A-like protein
MRQLASFRPRFAWGILAFVLLAVAAACTRPPAPESGPATQPFSDARRGPSRDLSQDEAAGGHTLRKHVGRTDAELGERLRRERNISAASTWNDRESAEAAVGAALAQESNKISRWLARENGHPNLVLDYDGDAAHPFGRTLRRGDDRVVPCAQAVIVLKWDGANNYHVLTAYPECRR